jgi:hypothetical protein
LPITCVVGPDLELGVREHRVVPVYRLEVERLADPRRHRHRVDRYPAVDPRRRVAHEQRVRQRRGDVAAAHPRHDAVAREWELVERDACDQVLGERRRGEGREPLTHLRSERRPEELRVEALHEPLAHVGLLEHVGEQIVEVHDLDTAGRERRRERVVFVTRSPDPQDPVEEELAGGRRREAAELEARAVQHDPPERPDLRAHEAARGRPGVGIG